MDPRLADMARVLVGYSVGVKTGDWTVIQSTTAGEPLVEACVKEVLSAGGYPSVFMNSEQIEELVLSESNTQQLEFVSPMIKAFVDQADATIAILAPTNTKYLANVDPSHMATRQKAAQPYNEKYMQRYAEGKLRWTIAQYPTEAAAQDAGMSLRQYQNFVFEAGLLDQPDPVQAWKQLFEKQQKLVDWISDKSTVHIKGRDTDLTVGIGGRTWINDAGHENFPGGEMFTGPIEDSVDGEIAFNYPVFLQVEVQGVKLRFEHGTVTDATATAGEQYLHEMLDLDPGARRLGEFAFGTNQGIERFTKNTLFDEKIGGTLHMALGKSIPGTGGTNESTLHWDMVYNLREGAEVTVDGQVFSKNGVFQVGV
ncbi:MAG: aminopeptidase [Chloroflexota bacterium]